MLASFVAGPNAALDAAPEHRDQVPGFYRLKVGDLEVTALFDGLGVFHPHWLNGTKATMDGVAKALHEDPHLLDGSETGVLVNIEKQLILVDAGAGTWFGGGALGHLVGNLRRAGYTPEEVDVVLVTPLHSDHIGGLTTQDENRVFPNLRREGRKRLLAVTGNRGQGADGFATVLPECAGHRHQGR